jgi:hypothetical protein
MRRLFWLGVGAAAGIYAMRRLTSAAQAYTPSGMAGSIGSGLASLGDGLREMAEVVREGMDQREAELRVALGIDTGIGPGSDLGTSPGAGAGSDAGRHGLDSRASTTGSGSSMTPEQAQQPIEDPTGPSPRPGGLPSPSHRAR